MLIDFAIIFRVFFSLFFQVADVLTVDDEKPVKHSQEVCFSVDKYEIV